MLRPFYPARLNRAIAVCTNQAAHRVEILILYTGVHVM